MGFLSLIALINNHSGSLLVIFPSFTPKEKLREASELQVRIKSPIPDKPERVFSSPPMVIARRHISEKPLAIIAARGWSGRAKWVAIFSLLSGSLLVALAGSLQALAALTADQSMSYGMSQEFPSIVSATSDLIRSVMRSLSGAIFPYGLGMCLVGLALFGIGSILGKGKPGKPSSL